MYSNRTLEAVRDALEYLEEINESEKFAVVDFLEALGETVDNGDVLEEVARAMRDEIEGISGL